MQALSCGVHMRVCGGGINNWSKWAKISRSLSMLKSTLARKKYTTAGCVDISYVQNLSFAQSPAAKIERCFAKYWKESF